MSLHDLGQVIAAQQDEALRESNALDEVRERIAARPTYRRRLAARWALAFAATVGLLSVAVLLLEARAPAQLTFSVAGEPASSGAWITTSPSSVTAVRFSDGSLFALHDEAHARIESLTASGAHVVLERGRVSADVVHRTTSRWSVLAGPYEVHVTGTQFEVGWDPSIGKLDVHVTRGSVRVSGGGIDGRDVHTGESFTFQPPTDQVAPQANQEPSQAASITEPRSLPAVKHPTWRDLAAAGRYGDAMTLIERTGTDGVLASSGPADLMMIADAARFSGRADTARRSLLTLRRRFSNDGHAPRAAFELGRIAFDDDHDYKAAATWFETCLAEDPNGPLDREASGRLVEASHRSGDAVAARAAARSYLRRYPDGPHAPLAKSLIQE